MKTPAWASWTNPQNHPSTCLPKKDLLSPQPEMQSLTTGSACQQPGQGPLQRQLHSLSVLASPAKFLRSAHSAGMSIVLPLLAPPVCTAVCVSPPSQLGRAWTRALSHAHSRPGPADPQSRVQP